MGCLLGHIAVEWFIIKSSLFVKTRQKIVLLWVTSELWQKNYRNIVIGHKFANNQSNIHVKLTPAVVHR